MLFFPQLIKKNNERGGRGLIKLFLSNWGSFCCKNHCSIFNDQNLYISNRIFKIMLGFILQQKKTLQMSELLIDKHSGVTGILLFLFIINLTICRL